MSIEKAYELDLNSERFLFLCAKLNAMVCKEGATWSADIFSGGFKFSDETPGDVYECEYIEVALSLTTLMRRLWAYRMSVVEGRPRPDLAATWELTRALAPQWAGFTPDRCSPKMQPIVDGVKFKLEQFDQDTERLEATVAEQEHRKRGAEKVSGAVDAVRTVPGPETPSTTSRTRIGS